MGRHSLGMPDECRPSVLQGDGGDAVGGGILSLLGAWAGMLATAFMLSGVCPCQTSVHYMAGTARSHAQKETGLWPEISFGVIIL